MIETWNHFESNRLKAKVNIWYSIYTISFSTHSLILTIKQALQNELVL